MQHIPDAFYSSYVALATKKILLHFSYYCIFHIIALKLLINSLLYSPPIIAFSLLLQHFPYYCTIHIIAPLSFFPKQKNPSNSSLFQALLDFRYSCLYIISNIIYKYSNFSIQFFILLTSGIHFTHICISYLISFINTQIFQYSSSFCSLPVFTLPIFVYHI